MKQIFCDFDPENTAIRLEENIYHYLKHVLRLHQGASVIARNRHGQLYRLSLTEDSGQFFVARPVEAIKENSSGSFFEQCEIILYQALAKGTKMDQIVRQCTETGVRAITPVLTQHCVVEIKGTEHFQKKQRRWQGIAREAMQQSGLSFVPEIRDYKKIKEILDEQVHLQNDGDSLFFFFHQERLGLFNLHECLTVPRRKINLLIGPEGGFSAGEVESLVNAGLIPIFLGNTVLRVETAALFAVASVKIVLEEHRFWTKHESTF